MRDFTLQSYQEYLQIIKSSFVKILRFDELFTVSKKSDSFCIIRHDVDRRPKSALRMAALEMDLGVRSTYYFRTKRHCLKPEIIKEIADMGHEIGYHYECLADSNGSLEAALVDFETNFSKLSEIVPIRTISPHGSPLKQYDNCDIWENEITKRIIFRRYGIFGCIVKDIDYLDSLCITDTGRNWTHRKCNVRDYCGNCIRIDFKNGKELYSYLKINPHHKIIFQVHPERWASNSIEYFYSYSFDTAANIVKFFSKNFQV